MMVSLLASRGRRAGFTLIELMVVAGVISLLVALLLPAVQAARESSRRSQCGNNLRQLGLGIAGYLNDYSMFPPGSCSANPISDGRGGYDVAYHGEFSPLVRMLAHLDQGPLYHAINFSVGTTEIETVGHSKPSPDALPLLPCNQTAYQTRVAAFLCPSDRGAFAGVGCNYRGNAGTGPLGHTNAIFPDSGNGLFPELVYVPLSSVPDGLSHTAAFGERVIGSNRPGAPSPELDIFIPETMRAMSTADSMLTLCRASAYVGAPAFTSTGRWWFWHGREWTLYSHAQAPNGKVPDCLAGSANPSFGMVTARSRHLGGVNLLMGDGSVRFIGETIAQAAWRGLGTRNGGELVD